MKRILTEVIIMVLLAVASYFLVTSALTDFMRVQADKAKHNSTWGSIRVVDVFEDFNAFDIEVDEPIFQRNGTHYEIAREFRVPFEFDGTVHKYNLLFNNQPADSTLSTGPQLQATYKLAFWDLQGRPVTSMDIGIRFVFSVTRVYLTLTTEINITQLGYLNQYLMVNGLKLRLIDEQYNSAPLETTSSVFALFVNNGETLKVVGVPLNTSLQNFSISTPEGYSARFIVNSKPININTYVFTESTTVHVEFEPIVFAITFNDGISSTLVQVPYNTTPDITPRTIIGFDFVGWDKPFPITSDGTYTAVYKLSDGYVGGYYQVDSLSTNTNAYQFNLGVGNWSLNGTMTGFAYYQGLSPSFRTFEMQVYKAVGWSLGGSAKLDVISPNVLRFYLTDSNYYFYSIGFYYAEYVG